MSLVVGENTLVTLHFSLSMEDGAVIDSTFDKNPARFEYGDGQLPDGFLSFLDGMSEGEEGEWQVPPEKAFGMPNPNNQQVMKRADFPEDMELAEGLMISFADANQSELPGVVKAFDENEVTIDFNHPLAGQTLSFKVQVVSVEAL
ncbi:MULTISPECIES: peptidylprolyl isomerase [unclassified Oleiphilus]|uniref:FKBP-type peptidyl-prolyl cis-trans isomerase n=2 Tax=Oleiphilus TaxID=141450 RepID=UPI000ABCD8DD|nr:MULTISPECIES: peptidylprolyl isomerase [unclassified Oleiphilus]